MKRYDLRVHFVGDFGAGRSEDVQMREGWGRNAKNAAEDFTKDADRCWVEVLSKDGRVIYTS